MAALLPITFLTLLILLTEGAMWQLFRRRIAGLLFPREVDASYFRFFTLARLRACALLHTAFCVGIVSFLFSLLW